MTKIITDNSKVNINLLKENELLKKQVEKLLLDKEKLNKQLSLCGVVRRLWVKFTIIMIYLPMLLIDYLISLTTDESYAEARKTTMTAINRQWRL